MKITVKDFAGILDEIFPPRWSEPWDNSGLTIGRPDAVIERVLIALDVTAATVGEALQNRCDLLLTHHPFPWRDRKRFDLSDPEVRLMQRIMANNLNLFAVHTNLDAAPEGHATWLARQLGLVDLKPLKPTGYPYEVMAYDVYPLDMRESDVGLGRLGKVESQTMNEILFRLKSVLGLEKTLVGGFPAACVERVAICPGSAGDLLRCALDANVEVFIGGEFSHHDALSAAAHGMALIDTGHFATEAPALAILEKTCAERTHGAIGIIRSESERNPFRLI